MRESGVYAIAGFAKARGHNIFFFSTYQENVAVFLLIGLEFALLKVKQSQSGPTKKQLIKQQQLFYIVSH